MNPDQDKDMLGARKAMIRAARAAADLARQHNQPLILWRDGKVVEVMPDDLPPCPSKRRTGPGQDAPGAGSVTTPESACGCSARAACPAR